jgi:aldehyde oxidoreductase
MISLFVDGVERSYDGDPGRSLLDFLRNDLDVTSVKDGCSEGACGACLVEADGRPTLSCRMPMSRAGGMRVVTLAGLPPAVRDTIVRAFVCAGAVQCGFCTPGMIARARLLLDGNHRPTRDEVAAALRPHLCRCTGYLRIIDAVLEAARLLRGNGEAPALPAGPGVGATLARRGAEECAAGRAAFVDDLRFDGLLSGALRLSDHPRARVLRIDTRAAAVSEGVARVVTAADVPGERRHGLIFRDWPLLVAEGEVTAYVGDVLAVVVARTEALARAAAEKIEVEYEVLAPVTDVFDALEPGAPPVHAGGNLLETCAVRRGAPIADVLARSAYRHSGRYCTQRVEHAYLETEAAVALPTPAGVHVYSHGQGIYDDRRQIAEILGLAERDVTVTLVPAGGAFGGKEDLGVQGHAALCAWLLKLPVKVRLSRPQSIRVHPKRHPMVINLDLGCDEQGLLMGLQARIVGDTGPYASVGTKVLERAAGHATGAYHVPNVDIEARTVCTNNIPCGAMRGFGVCQVTFALESAIDELCLLGGFDRWQFRYDNALAPGRMTATGQVLGPGVGLRATLLAVREDYRRAPLAGIACGLKNTGIGNGVADESEASLEVVASGRVVLRHGWTEMGQGVDTIAVQVLCEETGLDPGVVDVRVSTADETRGGMTTASRASVLLGNALIAAAAALRRDLERHSLAELAGRVYRGRWACDWTTAPGAPGPTVTHFAYGYATHLVELDGKGRVARVVAAHDAGRVLNPQLFKGQIEGAVAMGLGYALSESLPMSGGRLVSDRLRDCGLMRADRMPEIVVRAVEIADPVGPYGAKGVGEIGLVPTAAAVANALHLFDGERRFELPLKPAARRPGR